MPINIRAAAPLIPTLFAILGGLLLADISNPAAFPIALLLLLVAILSVRPCWSLHEIQSSPVAAEWETTAPLTNAHRAAVMVGIGALLVVAETSGRLIGLWAFLSRSGHFQFVALCVGLIALAWGLSGGFRVHVDLSQERRTWALLIAITGFALVLRVVNLANTIPAFVDEVNFIEELWVFRENAEAHLLYPINEIAAFPRLYVYLEMLTTTLFGHDLGGLRLVSAIFGALTVPAVYALARELFPHDRQTPWIAAALLTVLPIHVHFSRLALNNIADPFFGVAAFALLARGVRTGNRAPFVLAGIALGLTQYFHEAGRLSLPVVMALWLAVMLRGPWRTLPRRHLRTFLFAAVITALPVYYTLAAIGFPIATRASGVGLSGDYWLAQNNLLQSATDVIGRLGRVMARLLYQPELIHYYAGETPYIPAYITPLLALGLGTVVWRVFRPGAFLLLIWTTLPVMAIALLLAEVQSPRIVVILPALAILAALGLRYAVTELVSEGAAPRLLTGLTVLLGAVCTLYYFSTHAPTFTRQHFDAQPWQQVAYAARDLPAYTFVHLVYDQILPDHDINIAMTFIQPHSIAEVYLPEAFTSEMLAGLSAGVNHAFFVRMTMADADEITAQIEAALPDALGPFTVTAPYLGKHWFVYYLLPGDTRALP